MGDKGPAVIAALLDQVQFIAAARTVLGLPQLAIIVEGKAFLAALADGDVAKAGIEQPVYYWSPSMGVCQVAFYKGNLFPEWKNSVFVAMLRGNALERLTLANGKVVNEEPLLTEVKMRLRDVRVGPDGAVYVLSDSGGGSITNNTPIGSKLLKLTPR